ncbi:hemerythrin domain-containing protein [Kitasatospora cineracea]|uniref:Hemerythrin HHE cation binding domain-containing protein n=1 Tax=Kitasatospora cineracea TaxID=88074 RepID=A0A3N4S1A7_9ACTN|nr:hemerythrin domain-containing protein [Kitasatospora cineracea]ROR46947.1 hemerythrin HHE cation binding domain-containing protein [Kitasatospora cineracea]RPE37111.1 hemerythrin HHE cation binding domain-containing protein [Kitasatospora cineracea]
MPATAAPAVANERLDPQEMVVLHRVFRREIPLLADLIEAAAPGDRRRTAVLADHLDLVLGALGEHHEGEDDLLWPKLRERAAPGDDVVARMTDQHEAIAGALATVTELSHRWRTGADGDTAPRLAEALRTLDRHAADHMDDEEEHLLPLMADHITRREWTEVGERGRRSVPKAKLLIFLGAILEDATARERRLFLSQMPAPARVLWRTLGTRLYDRTVARVRRSEAGVPQV